MAVKPTPAIERVLSRTHDDDGCWVFDGAKSASGYGVIGAGPRGQGNALTHRVTYAFFIADIPEGLDLDHLCRNRACCNPWHLDPVTRAVNVSRGLRAPGYGLRERTHCKHGHEFTPDNTYQAKRQRKCMTCIRQRSTRRNYLTEETTNV